MIPGVKKRFLSTKIKYILWYVFSNKEIFSSGCFRFLGKAHHHHHHCLCHTKQCSMHVINYITRNDIVVLQSKNEIISLDPINLWY